MTITAVAGRRRTRRVEDVMTRDVVTVRSDSTIGAAVDAAFRGCHDHVVVLDETGRFLDVVPTLVLTIALLTRLVARQEEIGHLVNPDPLSVEPRTPVGVAVALMREVTADALAVVDPEHHVLGVLTWSDIGHHVASVR